jgi:asparagine synthase (glutamine-hydrolysing)
MCGINGMFALTAAASRVDPEELVRTRDAMAARGPDGAGAWVSADGRAALASRRLAILDLSPRGAQPMAAAAGRVQIVFNGEIYNFLALRAELEGAGVRFASRCDTEVVLALYLRQGTAMLARLRGMFGLAIWDSRDGEHPRLLLARDPFGIKPLYYSTAGGLLRFASQVKALTAGGAISRQVDPAGLAGFLLWGSVPEPFTILQDVRALPAGHFLAVEPGRALEPQAYTADLAQLAATPAKSARSANSIDSANAANAAAPADSAKSATSESTATCANSPISANGAAEADGIRGIEDSVRAHLISDVPVAVFLSAGLDSGLIAALARRHLAEPPATFTLSFDVLAGTSRDEAPLAAEVARRLGTRHVERRMGREDFARLWPAAMAAMDQPSIAGYNTFAVSAAAHEAGIKVALSGLGGDELFGSYPSFADVPRGVRAARWGRRLPGLAAAWPALAARLAPSRPKLGGLLRHGATLPGSYFLRRALFLPAELPALMGADLAAAGLAAYDPVADAAAKLGPPRLPAPAAAAARLQTMGRPQSTAKWTEPGCQPAAPWLAVQEMETGQYMRNQLLRDADWASMAWSVELRLPLVDAWLYRLLAAADFQPARRLGKAALVRRLAPELPAAVWDRPKTGFYIPVLEWLRPGDLGPAAENLGGRSRALAPLVLAELGFPLPTRSSGVAPR